MFMPKSIIDYLWSKLGVLKLIPTYTVPINSMPLDTSFKAFDSGM
jgi:hypothetical protein